MARARVRVRSFHLPFPLWRRLCPILPVRSNRVDSRSPLPTESLARDKLGREPEPNSSGSDLKVEIRTTSSGSGHVITDRWDAAHEPPAPPHVRGAGVGEEAPADNGFPPFVKVSAPTESVFFTELGLFNPRRAAARRRTRRAGGV